MSSTKTKVSFKKQSNGIYYVMSGKTYLGYLTQIGKVWKSGLCTVGTDELEQVTAKLKELNESTGKKPSTTGRKQKAEPNTSAAKPERTKVGPVVNAPKGGKSSKRIVGKGKEKVAKKNV